MAARYGESGDMIGEDGGSGDISSGVAGRVVITGKVGEDECKGGCADPAFAG